MPFMGDSRRRQLRRLSTKSVSQALTTAKDSAKPERHSSENTPVGKQHRMSKASDANGAKEATPRTVNCPPNGGNKRAPAQGSVNVFAFMEQEGAGSGTDTEQADSDVPSLSSSGSSTSLRSEHSPPLQLQSSYSDLEVHPAEGKTGFLWYDKHRRDNSMNSDSGISMLSSPIEESPVLGYKSRRSDFDHERPTTSHTKIMSGLTTTPIPKSPAAYTGHLPSLDLQLMEEPEAYYSYSPRVTPQTPRTATAKHPQSGLQPLWQPCPYQSSPGSIPPSSGAQLQVEKSGYDLLASAIDSRGRTALTPIYRKFETLNNRILLYLQDEIAEMEDVLKRLDTTIAQEEGHGMASRRTEAIYPSQAKWHRQELMCRIFAKVEQYNSALSSYSNLTKNLEPAPEAHVGAYKDWISDHAPLVDQETDFLYNDADLMTVSRPSVKEVPSANTTPVIAVVMVLVSTIVIFKVVPQLLARTVVGLVVGFAALCASVPDVLSDMSKMRESKQLICTYAAVMLILALVVG